MTCRKKTSGDNNDKTRCFSSFFLLVLILVQLIAYMSPLNNSIRAKIFIISFWRENRRQSFSVFFHFFLLLPIFLTRYWRWLYYTHSLINWGQTRKKKHVKKGSWRGEFNHFFQMFYTSEREHFCFDINLIIPPYCIV